MKTFEQNIINLYGEKGRQWLDHLPNHLAQLANTDGLSNLKPVNNLSYNYVLTGFQGSKAVILKLGLDIDGFKREAAALMAFSGFGVVEVLSANNGLLLLECAVPGVSFNLSGNPVGLNNIKLHHSSASLQEISIGSLFVAVLKT